MSSAPSRTSRIAVAGFSLESNAFAPTTERSEFESLFLVEGEALGKLIDDGSILGFGTRLRELRPVEMVPTLVAVGGAGGPCDADFYEEALARTCQLLREASPLDGLLVFAHGAATSTKVDDLDGHYLAALRETVGPGVPIVAELDLHANVSRRMVDSADILVGFRTNPHVDVRERSEECAELLHEMLGGMKPAVAFRKLPMVLPSVVQLTGAGKPLGDLVLHAESQMGGSIANVSILSGFAFSDVADCGLGVVVTARGDAEAAERLADELTERAWNDRGRYRLSLTSVDDAIAALAAARPGEPWILADVADNPGGGGRGITIWLLQALVEAGIEDVALGLFHDPELVSRAKAAGEGATLDVDFNASVEDPLSGRFSAEARVTSLCSGGFTPRHGMLRGVPLDLGDCARLEVAGVSLAVSSVRQQLSAPAFFEHFGIDPARMRALAIKSRGHFRAGFAHLVPDERILEVDAPGLTTPNLSRVDWKKLPRPCFPLDPETTWEATSR